jgi:hypothetical protein
VFKRGFAPLSIPPPLFIKERGIQGERFIPFFFPPEPALANNTSILSGNSILHPLSVKGIKEERFKNPLQYINSCCKLMLGEI